MPEAVIVSAARTPIGRARKGSLVECRADDLAVTAVRAALDKVPQLPADSIDDLVLGCSQPSGEQGNNLARVVAVLLGMVNVPGVTVNRFCSSSLQAIRMGVHAIRAGEGDAFICAGVEAVSRYQPSPGAGPTSHNQLFAAAEERSRQRAEGAASWEPAEGLPDIYIAMGQTAENVRLSEKVSRREMDEFAALSQNRAVRSREDGTFAREIVPVTTPSGQVVAVDDGPRPGTTPEVLAALKPAFRPDGEVTAGNSCPLNDGAAAVIVMSEGKAAQLGITPLARVVASGVSALDPEIMGLGPIDACRQAMRRAGMTIDDVDLDPTARGRVVSAAKVQIGDACHRISQESVQLHGGMGLTEEMKISHAFDITNEPA